MHKTLIAKKIGCVFSALLCCMLLPLCTCSAIKNSYALTEQSGNFSWMDLNVSTKILNDVYRLSQKYYEKSENTDFFVEALAYVATKNGNNFNYSADKKTLHKLTQRLDNGSTIANIMEGNKYYKYHLDCFNAVFCQYVGQYIVQNDKEKKVHFGLKAYFPLAKGYHFSHYDDFGSSRSYGFKRVHLGHDMFGSVGTPVVAIEGGTIEEMGWNQYGGWRIGIRSADKRRYYYYAHLKKGHPFAAGIKSGDTIAAGTVIGYLGMTGYSPREDTNLKTGKPHLHWGLQIIPDGGERERKNEIWVDVYALTNFLLNNRAATKKEAKEHISINLKTPLPF